MQILYAYNRDESLSEQEVYKEYWRRIDSSFELLLFSLYGIMQITKSASDDYEKRKAKHLPTDLDKIFTPKLWDNVIIQNIARNGFINQKFEKAGFAQKVDKDHFKTIYNEFAKQEVYTEYLSKETSVDETLEMLLELFRFCRNNEIFVELIEDQYANWEDDKSLIIGTIKKVLKALPTEDDSKAIMAYYPEAETTKDYGEFLLKKTFEEDKALLSLIEPVLQNWDADRVAILDMVMIKMALCELLYCTTIPAKVTLNEYVDLAKAYSTSKSKEFVNGILDRIMQDLKAKNLLLKEGRGLMED